MDTATRDHIWQHDSLHFAPAPSSSSSPAHLVSVVRFGDNIDDEWLCVSVVLSITSAFPGRAAATVHDLDGEFLLIEAAEKLPT